MVWVVTELLYCWWEPCRTVSCKFKTQLTAGVDKFYCFIYTTTVYGLLSGTTQVSQYQKKYLSTHTYPDHHLSITIYSILPVQFTCLHAWYSFAQPLSKSFGLPLGLAPFTSYSIPFFSQSLSSFCNTYPYYHILFCCGTESTSSNPSLSFNSLLGTHFYLNVTYPSDHSNLCLLTFHIIFFSYRPSLTSVQHTTLHTADVRFPSNYQWYFLLVSSGMDCLSKLTIV